MVIIKYGCRLKTIKLNYYNLFNQLLYRFYVHFLIINREIVRTITSNVCLHKLFLRLSVLTSSYLNVVQSPLEVEYDQIMQIEFH